MYLCTVCTYLYVRMYICTSVCLYVCMCVCMYAFCTRCWWHLESFRYNQRILWCFLSKWAVFSSPKCSPSDLRIALGTDHIIQWSNCFDYMIINAYGVSKRQKLAILAIVIRIIPSEFGFMLATSADYSSLWSPVLSSTAPSALVAPLSRLLRATRRGSAASESTRPRRDFLARNKGCEKKWWNIF